MGNGIRPKGSREKNIVFSDMSVKVVYSPPPPGLNRHNLSKNLIFFNFHVYKFFFSKIPIILPLHKNLQLHITLADTGFSHPPLADMSAKNVSFYLTAPLIEGIPAFKCKINVLLNFWKLFWLHILLFTLNSWLTFSFLPYWSFAWSGKVLLV